MTEKIKEDNFVGSTFPTPKGGKLTVIGVAGKNKNGNKIYSVSCSICNKDKELFPQPFLGLKGNLEKGAIICGCSKNVYWNETQSTLIINRICEKEGLIFNGFVGDYKGNKSRLKITCYNHGEWQPIYYNFVHQNKRCPKCVGGIPLSLEEANIKVIDSCKNEGYDFCGFVDGYNNVKSVCKIECKKHGKWLISYLNFVIAKTGCPDCSKVKKKTILEAEECIQTICKNEGYDFCGFVDGYNNVKSKIEICCNNHGDWTVSYNKFVNSGTRCPLCSSGGGGYNSSKPGYFYIFRYKNEKEVVYKFGITNRIPEERSKEHLMGLGSISSELIYSVYNDDGRVPQMIESVIKSKYKGVSDWLISGNTETIYEMDLSDVIDIVEGFL